MKPIMLTEEQKSELFHKAMKDFADRLNEYEFNVNESKFTFEASFSEKVKEKVKILFTSEAYLKCQKLVEHFSSEVGWYGLVKRLDEKTFYVYDILMCKQKVSGARVITDDDDMIEFYDGLTEEQSDNLFFQAHSHVNMTTGASSVDLDNQTNTVNNLGGKGFYVFQIWNKSGSINTYVYDLDNNVYYDKDDVEIDVDCGMTEFLEDADKMVGSMTYSTPKTNTYNTSESYQSWDYSKSDWNDKQNKSDWNNKTKKTEKKEEIKSFWEEDEMKGVVPAGFYWDDGMGRHGWD